MEALIMEQTSMTALISLFSRAYHFEENQSNSIFADRIARSLLSDEEYTSISENMSDGISFFNPTFIGSKDAALRWIVDNQLSPSPLGRAAYTEELLERVIRDDGVAQYVVCAAGYDTFAYRRPDWAETVLVFELDLPQMSQDKRIRLSRAGVAIPKNTYLLEADFSFPNWKKTLAGYSEFDKSAKSFCSMLGLSYYLSETAFRTLFKELSAVLAPGSHVVFDYPDELSRTAMGGDRARRQNLLAEGAKETMQASYSRDSLRMLLSDAGFYILENLTPQELTERFFSDYNRKNSQHPIAALDNVNYCLARRL